MDDEDLKYLSNYLHDRGAIMVSKRDLIALPNYFNHHIASSQFHSTSRSKQNLWSIGYRIPGHCPLPPHPSPCWPRAIRARSLRGMSWCCKDAPSGDCFRKRHHKLAARNDTEGRRLVPQPQYMSKTA